MHDGKLMLEMVNPGSLYDSGFRPECEAPLFG